VQEKRIVNSRKKTQTRKTELAGRECVHALSVSLFLHPTAHVSLAFELLHDNVHHNAHDMRSNLQGSEEQAAQFTPGCVPT